MKKVSAIIFTVVLITISLWFVFSKEKTAIDDSSSVSNPRETSSGLENEERSEEKMVLPLERARERVTKKPFGIFITPKTSPVQPERFSGFHTGTDFEIFPEELDKSVSVFAICSGQIVSLETINGYGGVIEQICELKQRPVRILYGHISLANTLIPAGKEVSRGEKITILGKDQSPETDGERKHLHLGIIIGKNRDLRGYVTGKEELKKWLNIEDYLDRGTF